MTQKEKANIVLNELKRLFPKAETILRYSNHWEFLVAVILSAQTTDKQVNKVTEKLFQKYASLDDYVNAKLSEFENDIRSIGFYHNKAKNILASARLVKEQFKGKVPDSMEALLTLPGVGRKTANVILGNIYHKPEGIAVDTHVRRLTKLYGLTKNDDPEKIEKDLMKLLPKEEWTDFTHRMIFYGRTYCPARKHKHEDCPITIALSEKK